MSGDYSRDSFDALRNYAGVFLQQGRAVLDSDWNEMVEMFERRVRTETVDTIGRAVVPRETPLAFEIRLTDSDFEFGRGRFYLDGMIAESFGTADFDGLGGALPAPVFDRGRPGPDGPEGVLDEMISPPEGDFTGYFDQPYWPVPDQLPDGGPHLVYLVVWQREVTPTEAPGILEPALGGLDTTTRWQTVWQVRVLGNVGQGATCASADQELAGWMDEIAPSTARLTTGTIDVETPEDPCLVPPTEGYTGLENQFYRVEIHTAGAGDDGGAPATQGNARFKFSRENASVRASVASIAADGESVAVARIGRDDVLRFQPGNWVEITDDHRELNHRSGQMLRVVDVDPETREVSFETAVGADLIPTGVNGDTLTSRHTRLIRWDQSGVIRLDDGTEWADLDAGSSDGLIPVPPDGRAIVLENGITVSFGTADGQGRYREMDHWRFTARTAGTQIEILRDAPPDGVQRHYARLAIVRPGQVNDEGLIDDCRTFWPPEFEAGQGCACTVCVTEEGHNSGMLTIQQAIDQMGQFGGTVCLATGRYQLSEPVSISNRFGVRVVGQGLGSILSYRGGGGAVRVENATEIELENFSIVAGPVIGQDFAGVPVHGVTAFNTAVLALRRLAIIVPTPNSEDRFDFGIALDGVQLGTKVEECLVVAPHAIGSRSSYGLDEDGDLQFVAFAELRVLDCILFGGRVGVLFDRIAINIAGARLSRNLVLSLGQGVRVNWAEIPTASLAVEESTIIADRAAVVVSAGTMRVQDCEISGGSEVGHGIRLVANIVPQILTDGQIIGNTIFDLAGTGIRIEGAHGTLFIKRNIIRDCGVAAIATIPGATVRHIAIDNNSIERIGLTGGVAVGIGLSAVESGQIIGNSVRNVGEGGFSLQRYAGIAVQGVGSVDISSNVISDIGGAQPESTSVGILAQEPYLGLTIGANRIFGELGAIDDLTDWRAIQIGRLVPDSAINEGTPGAVVGGYLNALPIFAESEMVYFNVAGNTWMASAFAIRMALPARAAQISVKGNQARTEQRLSGAMISVADPTALGLVFSDNQCDLRFDGGLREVVLLAGPRVSASGNTVTHNAEATSMRILTGRTGVTTPIGNIISAGIMVHPGGLVAPFNALNLSA